MKKQLVMMIHVCEYGFWRLAKCLVMKLFTIRRKPNMNNVKF